MFIWIFKPVRTQRPPYPAVSYEGLDGVVALLAFQSRRSTVHTLNQTLTFFQSENGLGRVENAGSYGNR